MKSIPKIVGVVSHIIRVGDASQAFSREQKSSRMPKIATGRIVFVSVTRLSKTRAGFVCLVARAPSSS
eukprot:1178133-Prorocentrum_minimum.AAC.3